MFTTPLGGLGSGQLIWPVASRDRDWQTTGTMPALLVLIGTLFTWIALYQGILAYAIGPPSDRELTTISGRVEDVATPWTRNRFVEATQVKIEVAPVRFITVAVRQETLDTGTLKALEGKTVAVTYAAGRPRNRWVYALDVEGRGVERRRLIVLDQERQRDRDAFLSAVHLMLLNGALALALMVVAWKIRHTRSTSSQIVENKS